VGFVGRLMGTEVVADLRTQLRTLALSVLTQQSVTKVILPTFDEVLHGGRADIVSIGFLLSLWSGSRALNVYVDTISIMYGFGGRRGIVRTRALSFSLYVLMLVIGVLVVPLVLVGPAQIDRMLHALVPLRVDWSDWLYWPLVTVAAVVTLATLYHVATPHRPPWRRALPGALLALAIWLVASDVLRRVLAESIGGASIYGPLSAPIVVLIWLYFFAIAVLIGAALNAAMDEEYPARVPDRAGP
jgi:membrane protein